MWDQIFTMNYIGITNLHSHLVKIRHAQRPAQVHTGKCEFGEIVDLGQAFQRGALAFRRLRTAQHGCGGVHFEVVARSAKVQPHAEDPAGPFAKNRPVDVGQVKGMMRNLLAKIQHTRKIAGLQ